MDSRESAKTIFYAALRAVDPYIAVQKHLPHVLDVYKKEHLKRLYIVAFGKGGCYMARAAEDILKEHVKDGVVITKYGHCEGRIRPDLLRVYEGGHPVPDEAGQRATAEVLKMLSGVGEEVLVLILISGGGSALLVSPVSGVSLDDKKIVTEMLLKAGADIFELNAVRKHISRVKGGRLAQLLYPSRVIGDRLDVIASGPTAPDESTYADAMDVLKKYGIIDNVPESIKKHIERGIKGSIEETPKEGDRVFNKVENIIIGSNYIALEAAKREALRLGFKAEVVAKDLSGEAREVGMWLAEIARNKKASRTSSEKLCLISGGETTVTVKGKGKGGRNTELALSFAMAIEGMKGITFLSAGTDGTDGPTDAAGAIVDGNTIINAKAKGLNPEVFLNENDSYNFFKKTEELLITGPTGTNVMDIQLILIDS